MFASKDVFLTPPSGGYNIARSVRLRSSASGYFNRTPSASSRTTWTWSAWVKRGKLGSAQALFSAGTGTAEFRLTFTSSDTIEIYEYTSPSYNWQKITTAVYRDPSAWYHIQLTYDTTNGTAGDRVKLYVNGVQVTSFGTNTNPAPSFSGYVNSAVAHGIGSFSTGSSYLDGYLTEINFIDGQALTPSSFGETDSITGVWKPKKYGGTYGTNGFYLNFSDNSSNTATTIGKDYSGNGNNWTPNNISVTTGATYDSMTDVPTLTSATAANYCTFNPIYNVSNAGSTWSDGNLKFTNSGADNVSSMPTMALPTSGKWYWEITVPTFGSGSNPVVGICDYTGLSGGLGGWWYRSDGNKYNQAGTGFAYGATWTAGTVISVAVDMDAATLTFYKNGVSQGVAWTSITTGVSGTLLYPFVRVNVRGDVYTANFGQQGFAYTPPTGFVALNTYNLPASTITNGAAYMAATLYTGNSSTQSISNAVNGTSFQPDFVWMKARNNANYNWLTNSVTGTGEYLSSNDTIAARTGVTDALTAFSSTGFTLGANTSDAYVAAGVNYTGRTYVGWQWKAGTTSASNTNGTITSTVSVGATQGFSVVTYTGNSTAGATVGHGLGVAPNMIIVKCRTVVTSWAVYHSSLGATQWILLNSPSGAVTSSQEWNNTAPTSTVFSIGSGSSNSNQSATYVAYCFAAVAGYSAFGSYTGNGSTDGTFVYLGFRPRFIMVKDTTNAGTDWVIFNTSSEPYNVVGTALYANSTNTESTNAATWCDILSNGFKNRRAGSANTTSATIIYAAFAENPFKNALAR
jgi:hypothetical protein